MEHFAEAISVFFLGAIILAPVGAVSARFAMKPLISLFSRRFASEDLTAQVSEQRRRIESLESELAEMHESLKSLAAASEFERRLSAPDAAKAPRSL